MKVENDTGTEDVEVLNLLAENQDPLNLSEGVTTLFHVKDGGNVRLGPHKATDLLVKKTATGERPKYQPPGHVDAPAPSSTSGGDGYQSVHDTGAVSQTPGRTTTTTTTGDGDIRHHAVDTPTQIKEQKEIDSPANLRKRANDMRAAQVYKVLKRKDLTKEEKWEAAKYTWEQLKKGKTLLGNIQKGAAVHPVVGLLVGIFEANKLKKEQVAEIAKLEDQMDLLEDWDLKTRHHAVDTPYQILEQRVLNLTQPRTRDDTGGGDGPPISVPVVTEELEEATDEGEIDMFDAWGEIKRKQALNASLQAKWAAEQEARDQSFMVANSGGLANLFRVKNQ